MRTSQDGTELTCCRDWEKLITVRVGDPSEPSKQKDFAVHESHIRLQCPFFEAALGRDWKEAEERVVLLPEYEPDSFRIYLGWLYQKRITISPTVKTKPSVKCRHRLCRAYLLGDFLQDLEFKDAIIDALIDLALDLNIYFGTGIGFLYENTSAGSPLRRLVIDLIVYAMNPDWKKITDLLLVDDFPAEAFAELIVKIEETRNMGKCRSQAPFSTNMCLYHSHGTGEVCYKVKYKADGVKWPAK